jgi:hypothetical protein
MGHPLTHYCGVIVVLPLATPSLVTFAVLQPTNAPSQRHLNAQILMVPNPTQKVAGVMILKHKTLFVIHLLECFAESTTMMFLVILILKL